MLSQSRALAWLVVIALVGCVRHFEEARPDEPHAVVAIRVLHHADPGAQLQQGVHWNDRAVAIPVAGGVPRESWRELRVRPGRATWRFETTAFRTVSRAEMPVRRRSGQSARPVLDRRWVAVSDRVVESACRAMVHHEPVEGGVYVVRYDYFGGDRCDVQCMRQVPATDGTLRMMPCGPDEPPAGAVVGSAGAEIPPAPAPSDAPEIPPPPGFVPDRAPTPPRGSVADLGDPAP